MNRWESRYAEILAADKESGRVLWWGYECMKFRLGNGAWYKPDFIVVTETGRLEAREVKGFMREAANVRIKVAAEQFPFVQFVLFRWNPN